MEKISLFLVEIRTSANSFLSQYEPLLLLISPLLVIFFTSCVQSFFNFVQEKGLKATVIGFFMTSIKLIPAVNNRIEAEKQK
ncbi:sphingosine-1-phosphate lyase, partial [Thalictrum thalictroides]